MVKCDAFQIQIPSDKSRSTGERATLEITHHQEIIAPIDLVFSYLNEALDGRAGIG